MESRLDGEQVLTPAAEAVLLTYLVPLAESVARQRATHPGLPTSFALEVLGRFDPSTGTSLGNTLRMLAGAQVVQPTPDTTTGDKVKALLLQLARDSYPLFLAPSEGPWDFPHVALYQHPSRAELNDAVKSDRVISRLYADDDPPLGRRGYIYNSLGRGSSIQSVMFGDTVIDAAWNAARMGSATPSLEELFEQIDTNIDLIRSAISGQEIHLRALLVFTGLVMSRASAVATPWGTLRPLSEVERLVSPARLEGSVSGTDQDGKSVTVSYAGELVLETTLPYSLVIKSWDRMEKGIAGIADFPSVKGAGTLHRRIDGVQLAALLAVDRPPGSWATARLAWQWVSDPLSPGGAIGWSNPSSLPAFMPYELSADDCQNFVEWAGRIEAHWAPHTDIAIRRILSAAHARTDPVDRLLDAVIAWENLFGTSEGEPRLRISSAMAWLLEADGAKRLILQDQLKRLYDDRSKIVHGAQFDSDAMGQRANDALLYAIRSLKALLRDRPDILGLSDGAARSLRLILDV